MNTKQNTGHYPTTPQSQWTDAEKATVAALQHADVSGPRDQVAAQEPWRDVPFANANLRAAAPELYEALKLLHDNLAEYQRINHLGGYDNHDMKMARKALALAEKPCE